MTDVEKLEERIDLANLEGSPQETRIAAVETTCNEMLRMIHNKDKRIADLESDLEAAYIKGWENGIWLYAINRDGKLLVGIMEKEYRDVITEGPVKFLMHADLKRLRTKAVKND